MSRSRLVALVAVGILLALLAGCVRVPTSGPVRKVEGQPPACQNCVNVEVSPPMVGDDPGQIVEGYLRATSNYQPNYTVARQFLTRSAAEKWSPEDGASIYRGTPVAAGTKVTLDGTLVGSLARDRTYTAQDRKLKIDFGLQRDGGEWRIGSPPPGLMVAEVSFASFYQAYDLFFVGNNSSLVPDPIYLPTLHNQGNVASALMKALLNGPSAWLKPAVTSAIPPTTTLSVDSVTITDGIAQVPLSDAVLALPDAQRSLLAAQIVYTLAQAVGVEGVEILVNQQKFRVPESDANSLVIDKDAIPQERNPVPLVAGDQLYAVRGGQVQLVSVNGDASVIRPMPGDLGRRGELDLEALAVSVTNTDIAVVTNDRRVLRRAPTQTGDVSTVLTGVSDLLRPQFTRYGELWAIGRQGGRQRMWMFTADRKVEVAAPALADGKVIAFKISPDGTRMALVRKTATGEQVGIARIVRSDTVGVNGWRALDTTQANTPQLAQMADVAWLDATELLVLGGATKGATLVPVQVTEDASTIRTKGGEPSNWDAIELAVVMRTQTAIIVGRDGHTWRDDGSQWLAFVDKIKTLAYPG